MKQPPRLPPQNAATPRLAALPPQKHARIAGGFVTSAPRCSHRPCRGRLPRRHAIPAPRVILRPPTKVARRATSHRAASAARYIAWVCPHIAGRGVATAYIALPQGNISHAARQRPPCVILRPAIRQAVRISKTATKPFWRYVRTKLFRAQGYFFLAAVPSKRSRPLFFWRSKRKRKANKRKRCFCGLRPCKLGGLR